MNALLGYTTLLLALFLAFPLQELMPRVLAFYGAPLLIVPALFCYGALQFPVPAMLGLAVFAGALSDLAYLHVVGGQVEIGFGWSIVFFVITGLAANGFRPMFLQGHWWVHIPISVVITSLYLALQFVMISFRREGFYFSEVAAWRIIGSGLLAGLIAPFIHVLTWLASEFLTATPRRRTVNP